MQLEIEDGTVVRVAKALTAPVRGGARPGSGRKKGSPGIPGAGRPREIDRDALGIELCYRVSQGELAREVCQDLGIHVSSPWEWARDDDTFADMYAQARVQQAHAWAEQAMEIARGTDALGMTFRAIIELATDGMEAAQARRLASVLENGLVNRNRLQVDTIKWFVSKIAPKIYGEKIDITSGDKPIAPATMMVEFVAGPGEVSPEAGGHLPEQT